MYLELNHKKLKKKSQTVHKTSYLSYINILCMFLEILGHIGYIQRIPPNFNLHKIYYKNGKIIIYATANHNHTK